MHIHICIPISEFYAQEAPSSVSSLQTKAKQAHGVFSSYLEPSPGMWSGSSGSRSSAKKPRSISVDLPDLGPPNTLRSRMLFVFPSLLVSTCAAAGCTCRLPSSATTINGILRGRTLGGDACLSGEQSAVRDSFRRQFVAASLLSASERGVFGVVGVTSCAAHRTLAVLSGDPSA